MKTQALTLLSFVCALQLAGAENPAPPENESASESTALRLHRGRDADGWTYLAYVKPLSYSVGHGDLQRYQQGAPEKLAIAGVGFETGLIAHAVSSVTYELRGKCTEFRAAYGLPYGSVARFVVLCDGKEAFRSSRVWAQGGTRRHGIGKPIHLDVTGVDILELRTYGDDNGQVAGSFGAWGNPRVR